MCFSAPVSGSVGAVLCVAGVVTIRLARRPADLPIALLPLLFGVQQLVEGAVWLSFGPGTSDTTAPIIRLYLAFALVLWPAYAPWATWIVEPARRRRQAIAALGVLGLGVSARLAYVMATTDIAAHREAERIVYDIPQAASTLTAVLYVVAACVPFLLSSLRSLNVLGVSAFVAAVVAYELYARAFVSVWCFLAAVLSAVILAHVLREDRASPGWFTDVRGSSPRQADL